MTARTFKRPYWLHLRDICCVYNAAYVNKLDIDSNVIAFQLAYDYLPISSFSPVAREIH